MNINDMMRDGGVFDIRLASAMRTLCGALTECDGTGEGKDIEALKRVAVLAMLAVLAYCESKGMDIERLKNDNNDGTIH